MNLSELTPAPWMVHDMGDDDWCIADATGRYVPGLEHFRGAKAKAVAERIVVEHNAFDIQMRRKWTVTKVASDDTWYAVDRNGVGIELATMDSHKDPCTAIIEAEKFYVTPQPPSPSQT